MIKAVIFDVGGVLIRTVDPQPRLALEKSLGLAAGQAEAIVFNSEMGRAAQLGEISSTALWQWVQEHLGLQDEAALSAFQEGFFGGDQLDTALIALIRSLRPHYRTAIISNYMDEMGRLLADVHGVADAFDLIVVSSSEKIMKPDAAIFERTLARLGIRPEEAVFIDDFAHNVEGARAVGMHAIHYMAGMDVGAALAGVGVEPGRP